MRYRDVEFEVVQTASPTGWKWTAHLGENRTRTGTSDHSRNHAVGLAHRAIDRAMAEQMGTGTPGISQVKPEALSGS